MPFRDKPSRTERLKEKFNNVARTVMAWTLVLGSIGTPAYYQYGTTNVQEVTVVDDSGPGEKNRYVETDKGRFNVDSSFWHGQSKDDAERIYNKVANTKDDYVSSYFSDYYSRKPEDSVFEIKTYGWHLLGSWQPNIIEAKQITPAMQKARAEQQKKAEEAAIKAAAEAEAKAAAEAEAKAAADAAAKAQADAKAKADAEAAAALAATTTAPVTTTTTTPAPSTTTIINTQPTAVTVTAQPVNKDVTYIVDGYKVEVAGPPTAVDQITIKSVKPPAPAVTTTPVTPAPVTTIIAPATPAVTTPETSVTASTPATTTPEAATTAPATTAATPATETSSTTAVTPAATGTTISAPPVTTGETPAATPASTAPSTAPVQTVSATPAKPAAPRPAGP